MNDHDDNIIEIPDELIYNAFPTISDETHAEIVKACANAAQAMSDAIAQFTEQLVAAFSSIDWAAIADAIDREYERMNEQDAEGIDIFGNDPVEPEN